MHGFADDYILDRSTTTLILIRSPRVLFARSTYNLISSLFLPKTPASSVVS